jgi:tRNA U34 2-thiouridine synthase MnmA/TrmU
MSQGVDPFVVAAQDHGLDAEAVVLYARLLLEAKKLCIESENQFGQTIREYVPIEPSNCEFRDGKLVAVHFGGRSYDPSYLVPDQQTRIAGLRAAKEIIGADAKFRLAKTLSLAEAKSEEAEAINITLVRPERKLLPGQKAELRREDKGGN